MILLSSHGLSVKADETEPTELKILVFQFVLLYKLIDEIYYMFRFLDRFGLVTRIDQLTELKKKNINLFFILLKINK